MLIDFTLQQLVLRLFALLFIAGIHGAAVSATAVALGDQGPRHDGRLSLNPFVHLDIPIVERYLANMKRIMKPGGSIVLHYSDKTKPMAQRNKAFAENDPETMRRLVTSAGYTIHDEDTKTLWHGAMIRFGF